MTSPLTAGLGRVVVLLAEIGESDCEELGSGFLAQPINALTSFAYVVVGLAVAGRALQQHRNVARSVVFGLCLVGVGLGSVVFHGPQWQGARLLHDLPILVTAVFIVAHDLGLVVPRLRSPVPVFVAGSALALALGFISLDAVAVGTGMTLIAVAGLELVIYRRRLRSEDARAQLGSYGAIIAVAAVAGTTWLLGRTDSPACDPDAVFQFHGLWHVLSALIFGLWWWLALGRSPEADAGHE